MCGVLYGRSWTMFHATSRERPASGTGDLRIEVRSVSAPNRRLWDLRNGGDLTGVAQHNHRQERYHRVERRFASAKVTEGHMHIDRPLLAAICVCFPTLCFAGPQDVSAELRQKAIQSCTGDAMRLCPTSLMDEGEAISCMADKRPQLTQSCKTVYDQVARILKRG